MQDAQVLNRIDLSYMKLRPKQNLKLRDFFSHTKNRDYKTRIAGKKKKKKKARLRETPMAAISMVFWPPLRKIMIQQNATHQRATDHDRDA